MISVSFYFRKVNKCYRGRSCPIIVHCRQVQLFTRINRCSLPDKKATVKYTRRTCPCFVNAPNWHFWREPKLQTEVSRPLMTCVVCVPRCAARPAWAALVLGPAGHGRKRGLTPCVSSSPRAAPTQTPWDGIFHPWRSLSRQLTQLRFGCWGMLRAR